jgi:hypothetical protein
MIDDLKHTNTSVVLTDDGVADAAAAFQQVFRVEVANRSGMPA